MKQRDPQESVLLVPALELAQALDEFRSSFDPSARSGVPPHITIMYPFLEPDRLTDAVLSELQLLLKPIASFDFALTEIREFDQGVLYLAPEPADRFVELTTRVGRQFGLQPYGGQFPTITPHLTVAQSADEAARASIADRLKRSLPLAARASHAWLMVGRNDATWRIVQITRFS